MSTSAPEQLSILTSDRQTARLLRYVRAVETVRAFVRRGGSGLTPERAAMHRELNEARQACIDAGDIPEIQP